MVRLVDDKQIVVISQGVHIYVGAVVRGHRDGMHFAAPVSVDTDRARIELANGSGPLMKKLPGRDDNQSRFPERFRWQ